jgi:hypothetical protein
VTPGGAISDGFHRRGMESQPEHPYTVGDVYGLDQLKHLRDDLELIRKLLARPEFRARKFVTVLRLAG